MHHLHGLALQDRQSLPTDGFFGETRLKAWRSEFMSLRSGVKGVSDDRLEAHYQESISSLIEILAGSLSALAMGETALEVMKATAPADGTSTASRRHGEAALQSLIRYLQLTTMGQADRFADDAELPIIERLRVKKQDYYAWLESLPRRMDAVRRGYPRLDAGEALHYSDGSGGNFALDRLEGDGSLEIIVPVSMSLGLLEEKTDSPDAAPHKESSRYTDITRSGIKLAGDVMGAMKVHAVTSRSLVTISAVIALGQEWNRTGDNRDNLKILGACVAFVGAGMGLTEAIVDRRNQAVTGSGAVAWGFTSSRHWVVIARGAKYGGVFLSLYEVGNTLSAAETARRRGVPIEVTGNYLKATFAGIGVAVGFLSGWPALVGGLLLALLGGYLANAYKALVPLACSSWLNRCFLRRQVDRSGRGWGQIEPFEDASHEVRSLGMVFAGITVDLLWEDIVIDEDNDSDSNLLPHMRPRTGATGIASGYSTIAMQGQINRFNGKKIKIEVTVPDLDRMELKLKLQNGEDDKNDELFNYFYKKEDKPERLMPEIHQGDKDVALRGNIEKYEKKYKISLVKLYLDSRLDDYITLEVQFFNKIQNNIKIDSFNLRLA